MKGLLSNQTLFNNRMFGPNISPIKNTQRGIASITNGNTSVTVVLSTIDITKSIVKISYFGVGTLQPRAVITNSTTLTITRYASSGTTNVNWEVIEYNNVKSLQSGNLNLTGSTESVVSVSSINTLKSTLYVSHSTNDTDLNQVSLRDRIIDSTSIGFKFDFSDTSTATIQWYLIEFQ